MTGVCISHSAHMYNCELGHMYIMYMIHICFCSVTVATAHCSLACIHILVHILDMAGCSCSIDVTSSAS